MTWLTLEKSYAETLNEIKKQRDRGAAIIAASVLEDHLLAAIQSRLHRNDTIESKIFKGYGPLASFSAKIDLGFLLGLYSSTSHKQIHRIREIRNEFAHNLAPLSFNSQRIKAFCAHFRLPRGFGRDFDKMLEKNFGAKDLRLGMFRHRSTPRSQFMGVAQLYTMMLTFQTVLARTSNVWSKAKSEAPQPASHDKSLEQPRPQNGSADQKQKTP